MLTFRAAALTTGLVALGVAGSVAPALADGWGNANCSQMPSAACEIAAGASGGKHPPSGGNPAYVPQPGGSASSGNSSGSDEYVPECRHVPADGFGATPAPGQGAGGWFMVLCSPDGKDPWSHGPVWIADNSSPVQPQLSPAQVAEIARNRLRLPSPTIEASPARDHLVNLPTWLWLSGGWAPQSATASVPGVSVTASAVPESVSWSMGDGSTVTCTGPGTAFRSDGDPRAPSPDCGHTYRVSSAHQAGAAYPVTATVTWTVTWSGAGQVGEFPGLTTTSSATFRVAESQALNTG